ncbi:oocyte zinc finger protein XlCOF6 isoform X2 [Scyliorhinus canicula]|uniref:oocyte zinc finger protein XlCOF6 isoform X2 n=1 Tax=Scyliorhinus canicula TaxID=7830 RepID=UPI0018F40102|nr:oocyte zinc finger protein XlCOF6 isoform X2 [Scyliorhinus canicula]
MIILKKMNEAKFVCHNIPPVTLHLSEETTTSSLYVSNMEDTEHHFKNFVELFLVEVYRCKICAFTCSLKIKMNSHVEDLHKPEVNDQPSKRVSGTCHTEHDSSYSTDVDMDTESKVAEDIVDNLERMSFLLPMYRMLHNISPVSCEIGLGGHDDDLHTADACEVTLFEVESTSFQFDEPHPMASGPQPSPVETGVPEDDEEAQSEHLMSLGLCRISNNNKTHTVNLEDNNDHVILRKQRQLSKKKRNENKYSNNVKKPPAGSKNEHYICKMCKLDLKSKDIYNLHLNCHDSDTGFKCMYCGCCMTEWNLMEQHLESHNAKRSTYRCSFCKKVFTRQRAWELHKVSHQQKPGHFYCSKCPSFYSSENVRDLHSACHYQNAFKCTECDFTDQAWNKVYKHLCNHDNSIKPHGCTDCDKRFFRTVELKEHMAKHNETRPFLCQFCGRTFKYRRQVNKHRRQVHQKTKEKREKENEITRKRHEEKGLQIKSKKPGKEFVCNICTRKCSSKLALQRHMGTHTGIKPFHCQHCDYKTRLKASLIQHMRIHTGEKPFKCTICQYASIDASSLRRHSRTHSTEKPYKCQLCSYSCIQKKSLDLHVRRHHTGETFGCHLCIYSSPDKQLLQKHLKKHQNGMEESLRSVQTTSGVEPFTTECFVGAPDILQTGES